MQIIHVILVNNNEQEQNYYYYYILGNKKTRSPQIIFRYYSIKKGCWVLLHACFLFIDSLCYNNVMWCEEEHDKYLEKVDFLLKTGEKKVEKLWKGFRKVLIYDPLYIGIIDRIVNSSSLHSNRISEMLRKRRMINDHLYMINVWSFVVILWALMLGVIR